MKRRLVGEELVISKLSLERMKDELDYNKYQFDICDLKLKRGLETEYKKSVRDYKRLKKEFEEEIKILKDKISILQSQVRDGVEIKNEKEDKK